MKSLAIQKASILTFILAAMLGLIAVNSVGAVIDRSECKGFDKIYADEECPIYCAGLIISSAQILQLNSTPLTIVASPGAGLALHVIGASAKLTYATAPYATNGTLMIITDTGTYPQFVMDSDFLFGTASHNSIFVPTDINGTTATQLIPNKALKVKVDAGNPQTGGGAILVYVYYTKEIM